MKKLLFLLLILSVTVAHAADTELQDLAELVAIISTDVLYVVDDPGGAPLSRKITALNLFDMIDTFAELNAITADETLVSEEATPTLDALWTFDLGVTITTGDPFIFGVNRIDNGADLLDGEMIGADTIDNDSIDWGDMTDLDTDGEVIWGNITAGELADDTVNNDDINWVDIDNLGDEGAVTLAATVTVTDDEATADNQEIVFTTDNVTLESDGDFHYNPNTGTVTATEFAGGGGSLTAIDAATGDSATAFFDAGTIEHEWGGLQADVSGWTGLFGITGADTSVEVDTSAEMATAITDETGSGKLTFATAPVFVTSIQLTGANADPAAAAGTIVYDNTIGVMSGGGLRWYDNDSVRLIVDLETDPSNDDYVVAYDAAADGFYMLDSSGFGGATAWDDIADPDAAATIDFVTYTQTIDIGVTDTGGPKSGLILDVTGLGAGLTDVVALKITTATDDDTDYVPIEVRDDSGVANDLLFSVASDGDIYTDSQLVYKFGAVIYQAVDNYILFSDNGDNFWMYFDGTDCDLTWTDGVLNIRNDEDGVDGIVEIEGKDAGEKGILRVMSDGDDKHIELHHDDTDGHIITNTGDIHIEPAGGDTIFTGILGDDDDMIFECDANNNGGNHFRFNDGAGAEVVRIGEDGLISTILGFDAIGDLPMNYGSADVDDHTFTTDGVGTAEFQIPAGSIDSAEILDATVTEVDLNVTNAPGAGEDDFILSYNHAGTNMTWVAAGAGDMLRATYDAGLSGGVDMLTTVDSTYASDYVLLIGAAVGTNPPKTDGGLTYAADSGTLSSTVLTEGGLAVYNSGETPSGSLGGTYANITIDDLFIKLAGDVATAGDYDFGGANVDLEIPQTSPAVPDVDGQIEYDFTDGKLVMQHSSGHAELGGSTDVALTGLIKSWGGTIYEPDGINDVMTVKAINSIEFPHGVVITAIYLGVSEDSDYTLTVQNFDDFDTINGVNPTIDTVAYSNDTTGEIIDTTPTFATIAAGQIIMVSIPATDVDWIHFEIYYYEPAA